MEIDCLFSERTASLANELPRINSSEAFVERVVTVLLPRASAHISCLLLLSIEYSSEVVLSQVCAFALTRVFPVSRMLVFVFFDAR